MSLALFGASPQGFKCQNEFSTIFATSPLRARNFDYFLVFENVVLVSTLIQLSRLTNFAMTLGSFVFFGRVQIGVALLKSETLEPLYKEIQPGSPTASDMMQKNTPTRVARKQIWLD